MTKTQQSTQKRKQLSESFNGSLSNHKNLVDVDSVHQAMAMRKYTDEYQDFVQMLQNKLSDNVSVNDEEVQ
jgi:hypothetical protein